MFIGLVEMGPPAHVSVVRPSDVDSIRHAAFRLIEVPEFKSWGFAISLPVWVGFTSLDYCTLSRSDVPGACWYGC
jgi:hypothetical protein